MLTVDVGPCGARGSSGINILDAVDPPSARSSAWGPLAPWPLEPSGPLAVRWTVIQHTIVTISLNGEPHELEAPVTVSALLERLAIDPRRVAVELNLEVVRRARYGEVTVGAGDEVEIVNFVGGG
jgi:thiamine biosynthesis protein ThiS